MKEMDPPTRAIVDYVASVDYASLPARAVHAVTRNFIDSISCMGAGCDERAARAARAYAKTATGTPSASAAGVADPVLLDGAVLANGTAIRQGEFHDDEHRRAPRSQIAPALFALAEAAGAAPAQFIEAVFVAYQVVMALGDDAPVRDTGFAQSLHISIGVVAGASKLLALDDGQRANAIAIALAPSIPMSVPERQPHLTWGSMASAHAAMTAIFAARLASMGITGPPNVFDGPGALWDKVTGAFEFTDIGRTHHSLTAPEGIGHRSYPTYRQSQGTLRLLLDLLADAGSADIEAITVEVTDRALRTGGTDIPPGGWRADEAYYSLPYLAARAALDRDISPATFDRERLDDPRLAQALQQITVLENPEFSDPRLSPEGERSRVTVRWTDGRQRAAEQVFPRGHARNPLSDDQLTAKFQASVARRLSPQPLDELLGRLWNLPKESDLGRIAALLRAFSTAG
jgi:2-methylcitrate dehydratase